MAAAILISVACGGAGEGTATVTGQIVQVTPDGIDSFSSLTVRDSSGQLWEFGPGRFPEFTPSHLIQHQVNGEPVKVTYSGQAGERLLTIVAMEDG